MVPPIRGQAAIDRFWERVNIWGNCWEWEGGRDSYGYGSLRFNGPVRKAHHVGYELMVGPVPKGLTLDHLCRNKVCVNPDHLEVVTVSENSRRAGGSPRLKEYATRDHCSNGHPYSENLVAVTRDGRPRRQCRTCLRAADKRFRERQRQKRQAAPLLTTVRAV